jgi:sugar lactone lactonase YvrE
VIDEFVAVPCSEVVVEFGEGVVWDHVRSELLWVDLQAGVLYRGRPGPASVQLVGRTEVGYPLGAVAPTRDGGWLVAAGAGFARLTEDGALTWIAQPAAGQPGLRMNDGACDPAGRFWAGTMAYAETPGAGTLYRLDPDGTTTAMVSGTTISNGLGWSADATTLWFADSGRGSVDSFRFDAEAGTLSSRRTVIVVDPEEGVPDGLTVDAEDHIWVALFGGGEVRRYTPDGELVARVPLPVSCPTSCCFGGAELSTLFISTAQRMVAGETGISEPDAGRLFRADTGIRGVAQPFFATARPPSWPSAGLSNQPR